MNNKGQTLVIFVILLPIFLLILTFVIDYGLLSIEKRKIDNNTYDAVNYYLSNMNDSNIESKTHELLSANLDDVEIKIEDKLDRVIVEVKSNYKSLYNSITNGEIIIRYIGLKSSKEIIKG